MFLFVNKNPGILFLGVTVVVIPPPGDQVEVIELNTDLTIVITVLSKHYSVLELDNRLTLIFNDSSSIEEVTRKINLQTDLSAEIIYNAKLNKLFYIESQVSKEYEIESKIEV